MTSRSTAEPVCDHPRRRAADLHLVSTTVLGELAPGQLRRVIERDAYAVTRPASIASMEDKQVRDTLVKHSCTDSLPKIDQLIAERRRIESYGVVLGTSLSYVLDEAMQRRHPR